MFDNFGWITVFFQNFTKVYEVWHYQCLMIVNELIPIFLMIQDQKGAAVAYWLAHFHASLIVRGLVPH